MARLGRPPKVDDRKWVYKALDGAPFTLTARPTGQKMVRDKRSGFETSITVKPIQLSFVGGILVVNNALADHFNVDLDHLVQLIEGQPQFGSVYHCIQTPTVHLSDKELKEIEKEVDEATKSGGPKVMQGPRGSGARN